MLLKVLLFVTTLAYGSSGSFLLAAVQPDCVTPVNALGACVDSRFCISIMTALVNNDHLTNSQVAQFLRASQCGLHAGSHKVCCDVNDIDFGTESGRASTETSTILPTLSYQPSSEPASRRLSDAEHCGKLDNDETPLKWVAELYFEIESTAHTTQLESKCIGTVISRKHVIVPAHCIANLPANTSLDYVEIWGREFSASKIFIHASYNQPKFANDIAIIELDREDGDEINDAVCLPEFQSENHDRISTIAVVKRAESVLKFGKAHFKASAECSSYFNQQLTEPSPGQFCAAIHSNESTYSPFVGAIAIESGKTRQYTIKGFTSIAVRTGQAFDDSKPYIFTDVAHHMNWISAAIGDELKHKETLVADEAMQDLKPCRTSNGGGFCVKIWQCSLYRDAPQPITARREAFLNEIKCFTSENNSNTLSEDGVCCQGKYIELNFTEFDIDQRFLGKRGAGALDMTKCGQVDPTRRIVGGSKADLREFPWIGLIKYRTGRIFKFTCGASLISSKFVLTCAHCITNLPAGYEIVAVRLGEYDKSSDPDCNPDDLEECNPPIQDIAVGSLIPHPKYNEPRYANDVGLIRLSQAPDMSQGLVPICLPLNQEMQQPISNRYTVAGFGFTEHGRDSDVLLKVVLPKVSKDTCQSFHNSMIRLSDGQECYGGEGERDSCKGDSGNPLMNYVHVKGRIKAVQLGIVAAGHSDCGRGASGFPGIYSDINVYMEWILDNIEE